MSRMRKVSYVFGGIVVLLAIGIGTLLAAYDGTLYKPEPGPPKQAERDVGA